MVVICNDLLHYLWPNIQQKHLAIEKNLNRPFTTITKIQNTEILEMAGYSKLEQKKMAKNECQKTESLRVWLKGDVIT